MKRAATMFARQALPGLAGPLKQTAIKHEVASVNGFSHLLRRVCRGFLAVENYRKAR